MRHTILLTAIVLSSLHGTASKAASPGCDRQPKFEVLCSRSSGLIAVSLTNCRKIGNVVIEVKDAAGRTVYREEGKAMTPELVRRLDKGTFPKGALTIFITARDFSVSQPITIE